MPAEPGFQRIRPGASGKNGLGSAPAPAIETGGGEDDGKGERVAERREARKATLVNGRLSGARQRAGSTSFGRGDGVFVEENGTGAERPWRRLFARGGNTKRIPLIILAVSILLLVLIGVALVSGVSTGGESPAEEVTQ
jgi:hypothetical protein